MQCIHWGNETCITAILMIIVYHSCIRDQCWKSFPSPFFCHSTCLPRWVWNPRPCRIWPTRPGPVVFRFRHPSPTASASGRRGQSRKRRRSYGGPNLLGLFICSSVLQNVFPAIRKLSGEISFIFIYALILICFFLRKTYMCKLYDLQVHRQ